MRRAASSLSTGTRPRASVGCSRPLTDTLRVSDALESDTSNSVLAHRLLLRPYSRPSSTCTSRFTRSPARANWMCASLRVAASSPATSSCLQQRPSAAAWRAARAVRAVCPMPDTQSPAPGSRRSHRSISRLRHSSRCARICRRPSSMLEASSEKRFWAAACGWRVSIAGALAGQRRVVWRALKLQGGRWTARKRLWGGRCAMKLQDEC